MTSPNPENQEKIYEIARAELINPGCRCWWYKASCMGRLSFKVQHIAADWVVGIAGSCNRFIGI